MLSAHRMPDAMFAYAEDGVPAGCRDHRRRRRRRALARHAAAKTTVPVLGVPVPSKYLRGEDSLYSIVQMPKGIPVVTFAIGEAGALTPGVFAVVLPAQGDGRGLPPKLEPVPRRSNRTCQRADGCRPTARVIGPTGAWLGLLGGGQLGRMFRMAAQSMGYKVAVLDPATCPAGSVADRHIRADYRQRRSGCPCKPCQRRDDGVQVPAAQSRLSLPIMITRRGGASPSPRDRIRREGIFIIAWLRGSALCCAEQRRRRTAR